MDVKYLMPIIVSAIALLFSFLTLRRGAKIENENYIFKLKVEIYSKILGEINTLINSLQENLRLIDKILDGPSIEIPTFFDEQTQKIDRLCFSFSDFVIVNSLIIPESVSIHLNQFCEKIINQKSEHETDDFNLAYNEIEKMIAELLVDANKINLALRADLHIENLNYSLYRRLK